MLQAVTTLAVEAKKTGGDVISALQSELSTVTTKLNDLQSARANDAGAAFVDAAIKAGRVGVKPLRDHYIAMHAADPARVEKEINAMPILGPSGTTIDPPKPNADGTISLNAEQVKAAAVLGITVKDYAATLARKPPPADRRALARYRLTPGIARNLEKLMTALASDRNTPRLEPGIKSGLAGVSKIYAGAIVMRNSSGYLVKGATATGLIGAGRAEERVDNSGGSAGDLPIKFREGVFQFANSASGDLITIADIGKPCYAVDDQTVAKTSGTNTRSIAGFVDAVDAIGVWVKFDERAVQSHLAGIA